MANHKSAEKRHRQNLKRRVRNRTARSTVRTAILKVRSALEAGDSTLAKKLVIEAESLLASSSSKKLVHRKNARRHISRLSSQVHKAAKK